ncbi:MAG: hypothetical protein IIW56_00310 [Oscillospiraceae bacterium]|nr:hypothetical protein [Oscillospiraceae bacterium]
MRAKERVLMLRLMEKLQKHPDFAKTLGIEATSVMHDPDQKIDQKGLATV